MSAVSRVVKSCSRNGDGRDDHVGEVVRVLGAELARLEPLRQRVDLDARGGRVGRRAQRAVHGHQVPVADELVQLDGVDVARDTGVG
jgi:hypothetical protein